ncbi:MAG TPA: CPBP family intramembrane glutamic endopeptidase, partial [Parvularculaceae bacterium]|nr:CPBP family intramembrane glutamic endopeptidase [Parvularculaceae bacterium]
MPFTINLDAGILIAAGLFVLYSLIAGPRDNRRLGSVADTAARQAFYRNVLIQGFVVGIVGGLAILALKGRLGALSQLPPEFMPAHQFLQGPIAGAAFWVLVAGAVSLWIAPRLFRVLKPSKTEKSAKSARATFKAVPFFPRNGAERNWVVIISLVAGVNEELLFRLALPLTVYSASGNLVLALIAPTAAFGLGHLYQGAAGVLASMFVGALLLGVYLASGSIWLAMAAHALLDLVTIVVLSWALDRR